MAQAIPAVIGALGTKAALTTAVVAGTAASAYQGHKAQKAQKQAASAALKQAQDQKRQQQREFARLNQPLPNVAALAAVNAGKAKPGGGTYLTPAGGAPVTPGMLGSPGKLGA